MVLSGIYQNSEMLPYILCYHMLPFQDVVLKESTIKKNSPYLMFEYIPFFAVMSCYFILFLKISMIVIFKKPPL